ncbi:MAG TPA: sigma-54 dependent transcriptional regulator [Pyrinomonadaceae bacterium]
MIEIIAQSEAMREVMRLAQRVATTDVDVLVTGESGTGKDALAVFIHAHSQRALQPLVKIDCAALPSELLEAELFGYERGAFTGATEARPGRLEASHKGTLILDEISHLSLGAQAKLLRVTERREFERLGGRRTIKINARLITLTNVDLEDAVKRRVFRQDLYQRLKKFLIYVPPLSERREDIRKLAGGFLKIYAAKHGRSLTGIAPAALSILEAYDFPGNVRELANTMERAVIVANGSRIEETDLPQAMHVAVRVGQKQRARRQTLAELEADYICETLEAARGNKSEAARMLGISRKNLYEKLARYKKDVRCQMSDAGDE